MSVIDKTTALYQNHIDLKGRMVSFASWSLPVMYTGILEETMAVRTNSGAFDISHMGRFTLVGRGSEEALQLLTPNDVSSLNAGDAQYSLLMNPSGGIIDDIIIYKRGVDDFLLVVNASNAERDYNWIAEHIPGECKFLDHTLETAMIAVQGPQAVTILSTMTPDINLSNLKRFQWIEGKIENISTTFCRTGYTGEDGFEIILPSESASEVWNMLMEYGVMPCGLGARDTLRVEAGYPLYGHEINDTTTPVESGLMWVVKMNKGKFLGKDTIEKVLEQGPRRKLVGLVCADRLQPRQGYNVTSDGIEIGTITSGAFSPIRQSGIGMAYIQTDKTKSGTLVHIPIRDRMIEATVTLRKNLLLQH